MMSNLLGQKKEIPLPAVTTLEVCVERSLSSIALSLVGSSCKCSSFSTCLCLSLSILQLCRQHLGLPRHSLGCISEGWCWHCGLEQIEEGEREVVIMWKRKHELMGVFVKHKDKVLLFLNNHIKSTSPDEPVSSGVSEWRDLSIFSILGYSCCIFLSQDAGKLVRMCQILRNYFCVSFCEMDFLENLLDFELCVCEVEY